MSNDQKPHTLKLTIDTDWGLSLKVECPYNLDSEDRPCIMYENPSDKGNPMFGLCGVEDWNSAAGTEVLTLTDPFTIDQSIIVNSFCEDELELKPVNE